MAIAFLAGVIVGATLEYFRWRRRLRKLDAAVTELDSAMKENT